MKEKGQSLVEFALSFVVLMFLLSGLVEFGIIFFQYVQLRDAAQEGALYGSICDCGVADIEYRALNSSSSPIKLALDPSVYVEVTVSDVAGVAKGVDTACEGDGLSVRVSYLHKIFMPFLPKLIGRNEIILNAIVTDTVLSPVCP